MVPGVGLEATEGSVQIVLLRTSFHWTPPRHKRRMGDSSMVPQLSLSNEDLVRIGTI